MCGVGRCSILKSGAETCKRLILVIRCILLSVFVGQYINCKNMHGMNNIKLIMFKVCNSIIVCVLLEVNTS